MEENKLEFTKLHNEFRPRILRYLRRMVGEYAAEDLTQDVFIKVSNALNSFRGESKVSTWIYRIATNVALDRLRSSSYKQSVRTASLQGRFATGETEIKNKDLPTGVKPSSSEAEFIRTEMNDCIRNFIEQLPSDYRAALLLSEFEGFKNSEIADILGVTLDTIKIRLHRARIKLKKELETNCSFYRNEGNELACDLKAALKNFQKE